MIDLEYSNGVCGINLIPITFLLLFIVLLELVLSFKRQRSQLCFRFHFNKMVSINATKLYSIHLCAYSADIIFLTFITQVVVAV